MDTPRTALSLLGLFLITACATAPADDGEHLGGQPDAGALDFVDAGPRPDAAPLPDAAPGTSTLTQSNSMSITDANSIACADALGFTVENHYYRKFDLDASGAPNGFAIDRVSLGLEIASAQDVEVALYTLNGAFDVANLTEIARKPLALPDVLSAQMIDVDIPATAPAGSTLVVELDAPDNAGFVYIGSNAAGETGSTYLRAADCDIASPTPMSDVSTSAVHWVLSIVGEKL